MKKGAEIVMITKLCKLGGWKIFMKSINVEGGFSVCGGWNFSKSVSVDSTFIREMKLPIYFVIFIFF